jgi:hypothetical protein
MKLNKLPILFGSLCLALAIAGCSKSDTSSEAGNSGSSGATGGKKLKLGSL